MNEATQWPLGISYTHLTYSETKISFQNKWAVSRLRSAVRVRLDLSFFQKEKVLRVRLS